MKKEKFYVVKKNFDEDFYSKYQVEGYVDTTNKIGYDRRNGWWYSTDISTGLAIFKNASTRKQCEEETHKLLERVEKIRKGDRYEKLLKIYEDAIIDLN